MRGVLRGARRWRTQPSRPTAAPYGGVVDTRVDLQQVREAQLREEVLGHPLQRRVDGSESPAAKNLATDDERLRDDIRILEQSRFLREGNTFSYITLLYWGCVVAACSFSYVQYRKLTTQRDETMDALLLRDIQREEEQRRAAREARQ